MVICYLNSCCNFIQVVLYREHNEIIICIGLHNKNASMNRAHAHTRRQTHTRAHTPGHCSVVIIRWRGILISHDRVPDFDDRRRYHRGEGSLLAMIGSPTDDRKQYHRGDVSLLAMTGSPTLTTEVVIIEERVPY